MVVSSSDPRGSRLKARTKHGDEKLDVLLDVDRADGLATLRRMAADSRARRRIRGRTASVANRGARWLLASSLNCHELVHRLVLTVPPVNNAVRCVQRERLGSDVARRGRSHIVCAGMRLIGGVEIE